MRVNIAIPEAHVTKPVLDAALESVTRLNEQLIHDGAPTSKQLISAGAQWRPEPPGQEHFDHAGILAKRGWGDCDDWAPLHAASLRTSGEDPGAKAIVTKSGPNTWHAVVERSSGKIDDPSRDAGMGTNGHSIHGAVLPIMTAPGAVVGGQLVVRPSLAVRPRGEGFQARVDVPMLDFTDAVVGYYPNVDGDMGPVPVATDYAMSALHTAPVARTALVGAIEGAIQLADAGGYADEDHLQRLAAIADACHGCGYEELAHIYGQEHAQAAQHVVGSFFGSLAKAITSPVTNAVKFVKHPSLSNLTHFVTDPVTNTLKAAAPIAKFAAPIARFVPGIGPIAATAMDFIAKPPTSFGDFAGRAAQGAVSFVPGIGPIAANFMPPGMFGGGRPSAPQQPQPQGPPPGFQQFMPQGFGGGFPGGGGGGFPGFPGMPPGWPSFGGFR